MKDFSINGPRYISEGCHFVDLLCYLIGSNIVDRLKKNVEVIDGNKIARVSPFEQTLITCEVDYPHKCIGKQSISLILNPKIYSSQIDYQKTINYNLDQVLLCFEKLMISLESCIL